MASITRLHRFDAVLGASRAAQHPEGEALAPLDVLTPGLIVGDEGDNVLTGTIGNDTIQGLGGNDLLDGLLGNDRLEGGSGDDTLRGDGGSNVLDGGSGSDWADYHELLTMGIDVMLGAAMGTVARGLDTDTLYFVENVIGTNQNDTLVAADGHANELQGLGGNDSIAGGAGDDSLAGGGGNDTLKGGSGDDEIDGGSGRDTLEGGSGDDRYGVDDLGDVVSETSTLATETDTVISLISWTLGANLERLTLDGTSAVNGIGNGLANVITGSQGANMLSGGAGHDTLRGAAGNDTLYGGSGGDSLEGGSGSDSMVGGSGNDVYVVSDAGDRTVETSTLVAEIDTVRSSVSWTLADNVERLTLTGTGDINGTGNARANVINGNTRANTLDGGAGNDSLAGGSGNDSLVGGTGNDTLHGGVGADSMDGGGGGDRFVVDNSADVVVETSTRPFEIDTVVSSVAWTLGSRVENLTLSGSDSISGTGNSLSNVLVGNVANNRLVGGGGNDSMTGGDGNDTYYRDSAGDVIVESSTNATQIDTVISSVSTTLGANLERLALQSGSMATLGTGNGLSNQLIGNSRANTLNGAGGNDTLLGGNGDDTLIGGAGLDAFRFTTTPHADTNVDHLSDFNATNDRIELDDVAYAAAGPLGALAAGAFRAGTAAGDGGDRVIYDAATGQLFYDADGTGAVVQILFATVNAGTSITAADFFVV